MLRARGCVCAQSVRLFELFFIFVTTAHWSLLSAPFCSAPPRARLPRQSFVTVVDLESSAVQVRVHMLFYRNPAAEAYGRRRPCRRRRRRRKDDSVRWAPRYSRWAPGYSFLPAAYNVQHVVWLTTGRRGGGYIPSGCDRSLPPLRAAKNPLFSARRRLQGRVHQVPAAWHALDRRRARASGGARLARAHAHAPSWPRGPTSLIAESGLVVCRCDWVDASLRQTRSLRGRVSRWQAVWGCPVGSGEPSIVQS